MKSNACFVCFKQSCFSLIVAKSLTFFGKEDRGGISKLSIARGILNMTQTGTSNNLFITHNSCYRNFFIFDTIENHYIVTLISMKIVHLDLH